MAGRYFWGWGFGQVCGAWVDRPRSGCLKTASKMAAVRCPPGPGRGGAPTLHCQARPAGRVARCAHGYLNVPSVLNMSSAPVAVAPMYAAYAGGASEDIAVGAAGLGGVHVRAGVRFRTGRATGGSAVGAGRAEGVGCCMRTS